jgi:hypothetical protein
MVDPAFFNDFACIVERRAKEQVDDGLGWIGLDWVGLGWIGE